jgi:hypothetical protein
MVRLGMAQLGLTVVMRAKVQNCGCSDPARERLRAPRALHQDCAGGCGPATIFPGPIAAPRSRQVALRLVMTADCIHPLPRAEI